MPNEKDHTLNRSFPYSLRAQMLGSFLLLISCALFMITALYLYGIPFSQYAGIIEETERNSFATLNLIADLKKEQLERWMQERRSDIRLLAENVLVIDSLRSLSPDASADTSTLPEHRNKQQKLTHYLREIQNAYDSFDGIEIHDFLTGAHLVSSGPDEHGDDSIDSPETSFFPGSEEMLTLVQENGIVYLLIHRLADISVNSDHSSRKVVMSAKINAGDFIRPMLHTGEGLGATGEVVLVTEERRIVTSLKHPLSDGSMAKLFSYQISDAPARFAAQGHQGSVAAEDYRGVPVLAAYRHIPISTGLSLGMVVKIDREEVFGPLKKNIATLVIMVFGASVLIAIISYFLSRKLSHTVRKMVRVAEHVESGDLAARVQDMKNDELGGLALSINRMIERLQGWNEELEKQVQERTAELLESTHQLRVNEDILNKSQKIAHLGSWHLDIRKNILTWSDEEYRIFGRSPQEFGATYEAFLETVHPDDREMVNQTYTQAIEKNIPYECIHRIIRKDGETRVVLEKSENVVDEKGQTIHSYGFTQDITEQEQAQREKRDLETRLIQAQKMEAIGTLAGGIAHDFNNILSAILGYAELAKDTVPENSTVVSDLKKVISAGIRAKDLVKQILAFSRQSNARMFPLKPQPIIKEALKMLRSAIPTTIEIQENISPQCKMILADPTQVHQILMNLCTNAYHAMEEKGGILRVELKPETNPAVVGLFQTGKLAPGEYVVLTVSDTGKGIPPQILNRIFDPYFTTKEQGKGTGLGLAIVHGIVSQYGGDVHVESEVGKGTLFRVFFPVHDAEETVEPVKTADSSTLPKGNERILIVDDEELLTSVEAVFLQKLGYTVTVRNDGFEAWELFQKKPDEFDLVITDQTMPHLTGLELAKQMLSIRPELPIILCTGFSSQVDAEKAKEHGIKEFMCKPLLNQEFACKVRELLDQ